MIIIPRGKKVLIRPDAKPDEVKSEGGIILTQVKKPYDSGTVVAVPKDFDSGLMAGQSVLFEKGSGVELQDGSSTLLMMDADNIVAIVN